MNISKSEIGLIKRMLDVYEKDIASSGLKDLVVKMEIEGIQKLREKIESDLEKRKGTKGNM